MQSMIPVVDSWYSDAERLQIEKAIGTAPRPVNRAFQYAWWNTKYHLPGEYNAQDATTNAIVNACIGWLWRAISDTPLKVYQGKREVTDTTRILSPIMEPNSEHTYSNMLWQTIRDLIVAGEVVYVALDDNSIQVLPWESIVQQLPNYSGQFPAYRTQTLNGTEVLSRDDVVKMLWQPSPDNAFLGASPLRPATAELLLDKYAREATAGRLQSPVVGLLFQPKEVDGAILPQSDIDDLKKQMDELKGTGVGDAFLGEARYDVKELQGVAHRFDYSLIYALCEARICAQLGVPPAVAQLGVGLSMTRVGATMREEIRLAYQNGAKPVASIIAEAWSTKLLPRLGRTGYTLKFDFNQMDHESAPEKVMRAERLRAMLEIEGLTDEQRRQIIDQLLEIDVL